MNQSEQSRQEATLVGTSVGNYSVTDQLGAGAMGEVYLGEHPDIGRKVAIKVLISSLSANQEMSERFLSEARAVNKINHPNIIEIYDFGKLPDGRLYYIMEYLDGRELTKLIQQEAPLSLGRATILLGQMAAALDAAHSMGIVHRDLKPDNVFVSTGPTGEVAKILDFGIAKLLGPGMGSQHRTSTGMIMGTPMYMSPEQAAGKTTQISPRSDIYAFGVIAYELLSGVLPLQAPSAAELLAKHITEPPIPLAEATTGLPPNVCVAVERALAKDPAQRPQSAKTFFQELATAASQTPGSTTARLVRPNPFASAGAVEATGPASGAASSPSSAFASAPGSLQAPPPPGQAASQGGSSIAAPKSKAPVYAGLALVAAALLGLGGFFGYRALREEPSKGAQKEPAEPGRKSEVSVTSDGMEAEVSASTDKDADARAAKPELQIYSIKVESKTPNVKIKAVVAGQAAIEKNPPFTLDAKRGERIVLTAAREGYEKATETFLATKAREIVFDLKKAKPRRANKRARRRKRRKSTRRTRRKKKTRVGAGTLKMD